MDDVQKAMRQRFSHIHPLMFARSIEKTKSNGELFDVVSTVPTEYPVIWDEEAHCWKHTTDLLQSDGLIKKAEEQQPEETE
jgi:hypothetical protein